MGLKILLLAAIEKNCRSLFVFGDSMLAINWTNGTQRCHKTKLTPIVAEIIQLTSLFDSINIAHVYRDWNQIANRLSKEAVLLQPRQAHIACFCDVDGGGFYHVFYRRPHFLLILPGFLDQWYIAMYIFILFVKFLAA